MRDGFFGKKFVATPLFAALAAAFCLVGAARALSPEDENAHPYPPGEHAGLVKRVCSGCHDSTLVTDRRYDTKTATAYYRNMVGDPNTEEARLVLKYLTTVLGDE